KRVTGGVLNWFILAAEIACGRQPEDLDREIRLALEQTKSASSRDYRQISKLENVAAIEWVKILRDAGAIEISQIETLLKWIENNDRIYSSTLTKMCHIAARATGMDDLSLILSSLAYDQLSALSSDAEEEVNDLQELARAIFCVSKRDAIAYFDNAIDIASKIGEEHLSRWTMLLKLAHAVDDPGEVKSATAYRLARIAELSYKHVARDRCMDWDRGVESLMGLCPSFGIAILSRRRDREFGFAEELLPVAIYSLIERGLLPRKAAVALSGTRTGWERVNDIK